ncbi:hypothetical protein [Roseibium suaedae]|uniref:Uncharacterized protein n=1 Tax=Roseibium suaedae TaxID=735517 RepID=A0A1M7PMR7_9HYPH|nr:hypothetical protein [Roseibium suaedae]SHN18583.1 hypothetical protein SAMN05444272_4526 [Roseibium suaedae]
MIRPQIPLERAQPAIMYLTASGRCLDLMNLSAADIHWPDLVAALVRIPRFNGATGFVSYSLAQHCCHAYDFASAKMKPLALLNDFWKAYLGELSRPAVSYLGHMSGSAKLFRDTFQLARDELSAPIFEAAGIQPPADQKAFNKEQAELAWLGGKLLATEMRDLVPAGAIERQDFIVRTGPFPKVLKAWGPDKARTELEARLSAIGVASVTRG